MRPWSSTLCRSTKNTHAITRGHSTILGDSLSLVDKTPDVRLVRAMVRSTSSAPLTASAARGALIDSVTLVVRLVVRRAVNSCGRCCRGAKQTKVRWLIGQTFVADMR